MEKKAWADSVIRRAGDCAEGNVDIAAMPVWRAKQAAPFIDRSPVV